jgi:hypothetical protein
MVKRREGERTKKWERENKTKKDGGKVRMIITISEKKARWRRGGDEQLTDRGGDTLKKEYGDEVGKERGGERTIKKMSEKKKSRKKLVTRS